MKLLVKLSSYVDRKQIMRNYDDGTINYRLETVIVVAAFG